MRIQRSAKEKRTVDNIVFDSIEEMNTYLKLKALSRAGEISKLQYEPEFRFVVNDMEVDRWKVDFSYLDKQQKVHVLDVKGWKRNKRTGVLEPRVDREFKLRVRLMRACFGLEVEIV